MMRIKPPSFLTAICYLLITLAALVSSAPAQIQGRMPNEEAPHEGTWLQWPHHYTYGTTYRQRLDATWVAMTRALAPGEKVHIIAYNATERTRITNLLRTAGVSLANVDFLLRQTDDCWVRDNGPIFVYDNNNALKITDWGFNGWGLDAPYTKDDTVPAGVASARGLPRIDLNSTVLEGGAIEVSDGVLLATRSSTLQNRRNPNLTQAQFESTLTTHLGVTKFIWLDGAPGGQSDITDMHIDGFARFGPNGKIVTMSSSDLAYWGLSSADINTLYRASNRSGVPYSFVQLPLTANNVVTTYGLNLGFKGSYVNYYVSNTTVLVPTYNDPNDTPALNLLRQLYPGHTVLGIDVRNLYREGGMVHCVTQQQPVALARSTAQFTANTYSVNEADGNATITVTRTGDLSMPASVEYATSDDTATQTRKYTTATGTLNFAPNETSKSFSVLITDNAYVEGNQTVNLSLRNPVGDLAAAPNLAALTIIDNDTLPPAVNPTDEAGFFVRQHYYDFLNRLPDANGWAYWSGQLNQCGNNPACLNSRRVAVSNAFFYEQEYQQTGGYVFRLYRAAFGNDQPAPNPDATNPAEAKKLPDYGVFTEDRARVLGGVNLAQGQADLAQLFVERPDFLAKYPASLDGPAFVEALLVTFQTDLGLNLTSQRAALLTQFALGGRGAVLYRLADDNAPTNPVNNRTFIDAEYNRSFVATQYFGYLRRDADINGFLFWLGQVNRFPLRDVNAQQAMVCSFVTAAEYQQRFSPIVTRTNQQCPS